MQLHDYDVASFANVAKSFGSERFGFVVTPNIDHLIRYCDDRSFRKIYRDASFVLNDSRFLSRVTRFSRGQHLPVCTGSDLTEHLLSKVVRPEDTLVLVGASAAQADQLRKTFGLCNLQHYSPPMGFISDPAAVEQCIRFIESQGPFRFCFLAVGCPQQEILASRLRQRGIARGLTLCVGASINYLTGLEQRAPGWMQRAGVEWLYRLLHDPRRLAKRYLLRGPRIFVLLRRLRFELLQPVLKGLPAICP